MFKFSRNLVYKAIDTEREYQNKKWPGSIHSIEEYIVYMEDYLAEAKHLLSRNWADDVWAESIEIIRKVTALGVACMEENGVIERKLNG